MVKFYYGICNNYSSYRDLIRSYYNDISKINYYYKYVEGDSFTAEANSLTVVEITDSIDTSTYGIISLYRIFPNNSNLTLNGYVIGASNNVVTITVRVYNTRSSSVEGVVSVGYYYVEKM